MASNELEIVRGLEVGININVDKENRLYYILSGQKDIETRPQSVAGQWRKYVGQYVGLVRTSGDHSRMPTGILAGYARLKQVKMYATKEAFEKDLHRHLYKSTRDWDRQPRCGLVLEEVTKLAKPMRLKPAGFYAIRKILFYE